MARFARKRLIQQVFTVACGATDQNNPVDAVVPSPNAVLLQAQATTKAAGTGTGTFSIQPTYGGSPTVIGPASATTFINADGAAGTVHGVLAAGSVAVKDQEGARLGIKTVKSGTVSADATLIVTLTWQV